MTGKPPPPDNSYWTPAASGGPGCLASMGLAVLALFVTVLGLCVGGNPVQNVLAQIFGYGLQAGFTGTLVTAVLLFFVLYAAVTILRRRKM